MTLRDQVRDPWSWVIAGVSGGIGWAVVAPAATATGAAAAVGVGVGAVVFGVKVAIGSITAKPKEYDPVRPDKLPAPPPGSPAAGLLARGDAAVSRIAQLSQTPGDPWLRSQVADVDRESRRAYKSLVDVAGRVTLVEQSSSPSDTARLRQELKRLQANVDNATDAQLKSESQKALAALQQRIDVASRLDTLHATLLTRMETAVVGLEGLAARMGEVIAMGSDNIEHDQAASAITDMTSELDTLRLGLDETRRLVSGEPAP